VILPGFQFRLSDLYRQPPLEELAEDAIYHSYVFPSYKKVLEEKEQETQRADKAENLLFLEKLRADKEKQRADKERQLKEKAIQQAEQLAAKLKELGIAFD
ncbi:hypothetical protein QUF76_10760, partial [Desulfobacterales bacterium HSG16]|nr:hypothetical protein [Desulfobacterales bacterium HSG16]